MAKKEAGKGKSRLRAASDAMLAADEAVFDAVEPLQDSPAVKLFDAVSTLGDQPQLRILSAATIGVGLFIGDRKLARTGLAMLLAHEAATHAKNFAKRRIDRSRPRSGGDSKPRPGRRTEKEWTSFPSGHSAGSVAVARAIGRAYPEAAGAALAGAGVLAAAQIPRCAHYPSDTAAGAALGVAAEALTSLLLPLVAPEEEESLGPRPVRRRPED